MRAVLWNKWLWIVVAAIVAGMAFLMAWSSAPGPLSVIAFKGGGVAGYLLWKWRSDHARENYRRAYAKYLVDLEAWQAQQRDRGL